MELIYLYIRKYETIFTDEEFNFSSNYTASFQNGHLSVHKNEGAIKNYYGENVNNVVLFLGQNGMGKSTLLDILGMKRDDRSRDTYEIGEDCKWQKIKSSYFMLYHLHDDYFGFEFVDDSFLQGGGRIENMDLQGTAVNGVLYKLPMGAVFRLESGVFRYCDNVILQWMDKQGIENQIEYAYLTSDRYNRRIDNRYRENDSLFERNYYLDESSYEYLYKYFVALKEIDNELLQERSIFIGNSIDVDTELFRGEGNTANYLHGKKGELDEVFGLKDRIQIQMEAISGKEQKTDTRSKKVKFLETFLAELIEYYFLVQFVGWNENEGRRIDVDRPFPLSVEAFVDLEINGLYGAGEKSTESKNTNGKGAAIGVEDKITEGKSTEGKDTEGIAKRNLQSFQEEYAFLFYMIKRNTDEAGNIDLKAVLAYTLTRVEEAAKNSVDGRDKEMVLKITGLLENLPEHYFKSDRMIEIRCDRGKVDERITELLRQYDAYFKIRNNDSGANCIDKIMEIKISQMSEGHRAFLDLIAKTVSAIYSINPGDSLVLLIDEPDRSLHPELSRRFLDTLLENINRCRDRKVQLVLTSHSPFIVTDVLPENVYAIESKEGFRKIRHNQDTFATNIYYLLMDSFMLENTFGEYSYKQLKRIMELLNGNDKIEQEQLEWIKAVIDRIGEKTVKNKMMRLYEKQEGHRNEIITKILQETDEDKIKRIREILENNG